MEGKIFLFIVLTLDIVLTAPTTLLSKQDLENIEDTNTNLENVQEIGTIKQHRVSKSYAFPINDLKAENSGRQDKMLGYFGYYPQQQQQLTNSFYPQEYYDYEPNEIDESMSRVNRRRPQHNMGQIENNSPIFYIRLPPTPYMFVPGLGYVSQPPSIQPMSQQMGSLGHGQMSHMPQMSHMQQMSQMPQMPQMPVNPFINVPLNFLANGKPSNIYQWPGYGQQFNMPYPIRPQHRPFYHKQKPFIQDSKIHNLKGQYLFNGRPEEVFLLQNSYNPLYSNNLNNFY